MKVEGVSRFDTNAGWQSYALNSDDRSRMAAKLTQRLEWPSTSIIAGTVRRPLSRRKPAQYPVTTRRIQRLARGPTSHSRGATALNVMKTLKILVSLLALAAVPFVQAQAEKTPSGEGRKGGGSTDAQIERIDAAVTLTADQKSKVRAILTSSQEKVQALPQEERRAKRGELRQAANAEIRALLKPDQQKKLDAMPAPQSGGDKGKKKDK
ncbi:MAG: hypothetical protein WD941_05085 [Opitutus sp.]